MKRSIFKDVILGLLPITLFFAYSVPAQRIVLSARKLYQMGGVAAFSIFVPLLIGAIVCFALIYAWHNRASTVFISLFCGAFIMNLFIALCAANVIRFAFGLHLGIGVLFSGIAGLDVVVAINGAYIVMFWISLICYIKMRKAAANRPQQYSV